MKSIKMATILFGAVGLLIAACGGDEGADYPLVGTWQHNRNADEQGNRSTLTLSVKADWYTGEAKVFVFFADNMYSMVKYKISSNAQSAGPYNLRMVAEQKCHPIIKHQCEQALPNELDYTLTCSLVKEDELVCNGQGGVSAQNQIWVRQ